MITVIVQLSPLCLYHPPDFFSLSAALLAWVSSYFCLANLPAFSCCLVFFGALPAASASFFFWLLDLRGIVGSGCLEFKETNVDAMNQKISCVAFRKGESWLICLVDWPDLGGMMRIGCRDFKETIVEINKIRYYLVLPLGYLIVDWFVWLFGQIIKETLKIILII